MISMGFSIQLTVAVLSEFVFYVACHDNRRQCLEVESNTICYFTPNVSSVDWNTAWKTCKELDATLPVILNEEGQNVFGDYLSKYFPAKPVWTAGRYIGSDREWKWLNGQNFSGTDNPACPESAPGGLCPHETQAVLTKDLRYEARFPNHMYVFICSYSGINCKTVSQTSIPWKGGCLNWTPNTRLPLHKARNECLKGGGDLATFSEDGDLQDISSAIKYNVTPEYWIGLQRKWWIWNVTDVQDIKYNLLGDGGNLGDDCVFMIGERSNWSRDRCSVNKNVICQTGTANKEPLSPDETFAASVIIGIVIAVLVVAIIVVILLIFIRRRRRVAESKPNTTKSDPATLSRGTDVQGTDDTYATIDDDDLESMNHKNSSNPCKDRLGNSSIAASKADTTTRPYQATPSHKTIVQSTDDTYATIDVDDDVENLNYQNGPNPSTAYTKVDLCNDPSAEYSELNDFGASSTERSTNVYADPYVNSSVTAGSRTPAVGSPSDIYSEVNKPRLGKTSDELTSPPIKIGPHGDIYTLPISPK